MLDPIAPQGEASLPSHSQLSESIDTSTQIIPPFDGLLLLRGVACGMVVIFHCLTPSVRHSIQFKNIDLTWILFGNGFVGVWTFFCISGYLMGKAFFAERYESNYQGFFKFYQNRAIRVIPLYYFAIFFQTILVYPKAMLLENWGYLVKLLTFGWDATIKGDVANLGLWSLGKEVQFYVMVPFIYIIARKMVYISKAKVLLLMGLVILSAILFRTTIWLTIREPMNANLSLYYTQIYTPVISNLDVFLVSFLMNAVFQNRSKKVDLSKQPDRFERLLKVTKGIEQFIRKNCHFLAILLLLCFYLFTSHHLYHQEQYLSPLKAFPGPRTSMMTVFLPSITTIFTCLFIAAFEAWGQSSHRTKPLSPSILLKQPIRIIEILGILSYGVYVWHLPILNNIRSMYTHPIPVIAFLDFLTATFLLSGITAAITYFTVEIPATQWKAPVKSTQAPE